MPTFTIRGNQIGEALQFDGNANTTTVEIGRVWFSATDTVTIVTAPGTTDAAGNFTGGAGAILSLTVTTATGQVTTFSGPTNPLDVDPDQSKQGADFFYISEAPAPGTGGAYAGLQLEKIVVTDVPLTAGGFVPFANIGGYAPSGGGSTGTPPAPPAPTNGNDTLTGTAAKDVISALDGNDTVRAMGGNDTVNGNNGNDRIDGGAGADLLSGGEGNDRLVGASGNDRLFGGAGDDVMDGGTGADVLNGGLGGDTFVFGRGDRVTDFDIGQGDFVAFDQALGVNFSDLTITTNATGTVIAYAGGTMALTGYFGPIEEGNQVKFDYAPSFDFV